MQIATHRAAGARVMEYLGKMVLNRKHFRAIIFYNFPRGLTQQQYIEELN